MSNYQLPILYQLIMLLYMHTNTDIHLGVQYIIMITTSIKKHMHKTGG